MIVSVKNCLSNIVLESVKTPVSEIHPYRTQFTDKSKIIIDNIFQEHTARRCLQGSVQKIITVGPTYLVPTILTPLMALMIPQNFKLFVIYLRH